MGRHSAASRSVVPMASLCWAITSSSPQFWISIAECVLGRSLNSCRIAFEELRRSLQMHPMAAPMAPLTPTPISATAATQNIKRPFPFESQYPPPGGGGGGREIRPKPIQSGPSLYAQPSPTEPPPKRKRGRPTKAESLAKREAAAVAGPGELATGPAHRPLPPPIQTPSSTTSSAPTLVAPVEEPKPPSLPPTTRMPIAAMLTPTAREPKPASQSSSSSSGKRRRARSNKSEHENTTPVGRSRQRYESPYERMTEDSPARTAVLRHREDPAATTSSAPRTAPPERPAEGTEESEPH